MKKLIFSIALVAFLAACSKTDNKSEPGNGSTAAAATAASAASQVVRKATYDPNLKPAEIVWDSPEKKARWEALQAKRASASQPAP